MVYLVITYCIPHQNCIPHKYVNNTYCIPHQNVNNTYCIPHKKRYPHVLWVAAGGGRNSLPLVTYILPLTVYLVITYCIPHKYVNNTYCTPHKYVSNTYCIPHKYVNNTYCIPHQNVNNTYCIPHKKRYPHVLWVTAGGRRRPMRLVTPSNLHTASHGIFSYYILYPTKIRK